MKKISNLFGKFFGLLLAFLAVSVGANADVMFAAGSGVADSGDVPEGGVDSLGAEEEIADPEWIQKHVEAEITKISPMSTPFLQISNYAQKGSCDAQVVKYYSMGTRPLKTTLATAITQATGSTDRTPIIPTDPGIFTLDDTILVQGVMGYEEDGTTRSTTQELVLSVCAVDENTGNFSVYAVNGFKSGTSENIYWPAISQGATLVRMGKACAEKDVTTDRYFGLPDAEEQYCQNFMIMVEQSTFNKMTKKEVNWTFSDIEEQAVADGKLTQEMSFLFGAKGKHKHRGKKGDNVYFTGGIWYQAGKQTDVGTYDSTSQETTITDKQLVDMMQFLYSNTGIGGKEKVVCAGSKFLAALAKIDSSSKMIQRQSATKWQLEFSGFRSNFGSILVVLDEQLDLAGKSDWAYATDPDYMKKRTFKSWSRSIYDMKELAIRNTEAVVIQEVCCLFLTNRCAHARLHLAGATPVATVDLAPARGKIDMSHTGSLNYSDNGHA